MKEFVFRNSSAKVVEFKYTERVTKKVKKGHK